MKRIYHSSERYFEKVSNVLLAVLGNSITFILAVVFIIIWVFNKNFFKQTAHESIRDIICGLTFLSLFVIQKSFKHFTVAMHLKINELIASHERASNSVINAEDKTELEIFVLSKEYTDLAVQSNKDDEAPVEEEPNC